MSPVRHPPLAMILARLSKLRSLVVVAWPGLACSPVSTARTHPRHEGRGHQSAGHRERAAEGIDATATVSAHAGHAHAAHVRGIPHAASYTILSRTFKSRTISTIYSFHILRPLDWPINTHGRQLDLQVLSSSALGFSSAKDGDQDLVPREHTRYIEAVRGCTQDIYI